MPDEGHFRVAGFDDDGLPSVGIKAGCIPTGHRLSGVVPFAHLDVAVAHRAGGGGLPIPVGDDLGGAAVGVGDD